MKTFILPYHNIIYNSYRNFFLYIVICFAHLLGNVFSQELIDTRISWIAPTTNEDNSILTDLAGYKLYYGTFDEEYYEHVIDVGNTTSHVISNLIVGVIYRFAITAYNTKGEESSFSEEFAWDTFLDPPDIHPNMGQFTEFVFVSMSANTGGSEIRYTIDGSIPTQTSAIYQEDLFITDTTTIKAKAFFPGIPASDVTEVKLTRKQAQRIEDSLLVFYDFSEGAGNELLDTSGQAPFLPLTIIDGPSVVWLFDAIRFEFTLAVSSNSAPKIVDACKASNEITIEAWIAPSEIFQVGPAAIFTLSQDSENKNFSLAQKENFYQVRLRTTETSLKGTPFIVTPEDTVSLEPTHVVYTREQNGVATCYLNGQAVVSEVVGGDLSNWDSSHIISLADEISENRPWLGEFYSLAVYSRALTSGEVLQNYSSGVLSDRNIAPFSVNDIFQINTAAVEELNVLANDVDPNFGDYINLLSIDTLNAFGTAVILNNRISYTPPINFIGQDSFSYAITDESGLISTGRATVIVNPVGNSTIIGEVRKSEIEQPDRETWTRVDLLHTYINPIVIMEGLSFNGTHPSHTRIREVKASSFEYQIEEWDYLDGAHVPETVHFIVMEAGVHTLNNGTVIVAGKTQFKEFHERVAFGHQFETKPIVFSSTQTFNGPDAVIVHMSNINLDGFEARLREQESLQNANGDTTHALESVGFIAMDAGLGQIGGLTYEASSTGNLVTDDFTDIGFSLFFSKPPLFLAQKVTEVGSNTSGIRWQDLSVDSVSVKVEEEQSKDEETAHVAEDVNWIAINEVGLIIIEND